MMFNFLFNQRPANPEIKGSELTIELYLSPLRQWLNQLEIRNENIAHFVCRLIPVQCPFARDLYLFGRKIGHIPPLCKLNPLYEEVVALRFRALCYLADECGQDIRIYC